MGVGVEASKLTCPNMGIDDYLSCTAKINGLMGRLCSGNVVEILSVGCMTPLDRRRI